MQNSKSAFTIQQQLDQLKDRGLHIEGEAYAQNVLLNVGYYRMSGYWWPLQDSMVLQNGEHKFVAGATFKRAVELYQFDRKFRQLLSHGLERIEVAIRTKLKYHPSIEFGPWWFEEQQHFRNANDHEYNLRYIKGEVDRSRHDFMIDHKQRYVNDTRLPPAWKTLEVVTFGTLSKLYKGLNKGLCRGVIARELGWPNQRFLNSQLQLFTVVRNLCAHHSRVWNTRLRLNYRKLTIGDPGWITIQSPEASRIYVPICIIVRTLRMITADRSIESDLAQLLDEYEGIISIRAMGFPANWQEDPFWSR